MAETPDPTDTPPKARRFRLLPWWLALPIVVLGASGGYLLYETRPVPTEVVVTAIRIEHIVTLANPSAAVKEAVDHATSVLDREPDFFLSLVVEGFEEPLKTAVREDTPIGNGLTFELAKPVKLTMLREVRVFDYDSLSDDDMIDRVDVDEPFEKGQIFSFNMISPSSDEPMPRQRLLGWMLVIAGGAGAAVGLVRFVALQVV